METSGAGDEEPRRAPRKVVRFEVGQDDHGQRLDRVLARESQGYSRMEVQSFIRAGHVELNGEVVTKTGTLLSAHQTIVLRVPEPPTLEEAAEGGELRLLYEDEALFVIDKPPGMASHRNKNCPSGTVADLAALRYPNLPHQQGVDRPGIVHRLDRDTSGVMVLAKTDPAMSSLRAQFRARTVRKEYRALVFGVPPFDSEWIDKPLGRDPARPDRVSVTAVAGREAQTYYEILERFDSFSYLRCLPRTGRTHQIRVHLTSEGYPLIGDKVYRTRASDGRGFPEDGPPALRHCLHAYSLSFSHPLSQEPLEFTAPLPDDMRAIRDYLRVHRPRPTGRSS